MRNMQLSLVFVKGTAPGKWVARFEERHGAAIESYESVDAAAKLLSAQADVALVRLPDARIEGNEALHLVRLYEEQPGVGVNEDSELSLLNELSQKDINQEKIMYKPARADEAAAGGGCVDVRAVLDAVQVVAAGVGIVLAPRPLLRAINNKHIEHRDFIDGVATTIALAWPKEKDSQVIQDFVGITRGRTANTSRAQTPRKTAREKAAAKKRRREESAPQTRRAAAPRGRGARGGAGAKKRPRRRP